MEGYKGQYCDAISVIMQLRIIFGKLPNYVLTYIYIYILVSGAVVPDILISVLIIYMYQVSRKVENNTCSFAQK